MSWGISSDSSKKEKIKSDFFDYLHGLNSCGDISYELYSELFDAGMIMADKLYELGIRDGKECTFFRYSFKSKYSTPIEDMERLQMPYWVEEGFGSDRSYYNIVCYLPREKYLGSCFKEPYDIVREGKNSITFTKRFPKPNYIRF